MAHRNKQEKGTGELCRALLAAGKGWDTNGGFDGSLHSSWRSCKPKTPSRPPASAALAILLRPPCPTPCPPPRTWPGPSAAAAAAAWPPPRAGARRWRPPARACRSPRWARRQRGCAAAGVGDKAALGSTVSCESSVLRLAGDTGRQKGLLLLCTPAAPSAIRKLSGMAPAGAPVVSRL